jgi:hypothetical protein
MKLLKNECIALKKLLKKRKKDWKKIEKLYEKVKTLKEKVLEPLKTKLLRKSILETT